ncbi:AcrR family transcriptional regulator [Microbacterium sp. SORGH_AS428]|uniref:TetR/AcrR family transcriptional regulator n=1 Tax=Microbacterium sp. SORGH_AS_0428 TaxID=3041788 RepID=UPI002862075C|nr:helix-turn-helix domain-containing protein [Microbacterium sp. SORGH_AS_0428]MDR6198438.1 AcrR family transcriptional regulator [Microbacterium sp. SORGH_AS_0428]
MSDDAGRRERAKQLKRERIFAAARDLFDEFGYARVTTQQVADRADVAAGTVFRYAATKAELLLMVRNEDVRRAVHRGLEAARSIPDAAEAVHAALTPLFETAARRTADAAVYQRELMFGDAHEPFRADGLAVVAELEDGIARILTGGRLTVPARTAARAIFACAHIVLVRPRDEQGFDTTDLPVQIAQIVAGYRAGAADTAADPTAN